MESNPNFWYKTKRFIEPAIMLPKTTIKAIFMGIIIGFYKVISIILLQRVSIMFSVGEFEGIKTIGLYFLIFSIGMFILYQFMYDWRRGRQLFEYEKYINLKYIDKILLIENTQFDKLGTGKIIGTVAGGSDVWSNTLTGLTYFVPTLLIQVGYSIYLAYTAGFYVFLSYLVLFIILGFLLSWINGKGLGYRKRITDTKIGLSKNIVRLLMSKFEVLLSGKNRYELSKISDSYDDLIKNNIDLSYYTFFTHETPRFVLNIMRVAICLLVGYSFIGEGANIAVLIGLIATLGYVDNSVQDFAQLYKQLTKSFTNIEKLRSLKDDYKTEAGYDKGKLFNFIGGDIFVDNISFSYIDKPVFQQFSIKIKGGTKVAFVGESGGGKTTLIKLLAGYIRPDSGKIVVDLQNLSEIRLIDYYKHVGYLTQDPSVFDGTVYENLVYALDYVPKKEEVEKVVNLAKCEFIWDFDKQLETEIGEKGVRLSGGQKQRLAIAKIMLKNPDIILLDEPTSALDSFNEEQISIALNNLFMNKTVVVVAHRLQTVKNSDRILFFEKGKIIEEGTHEQLVKMNGKYKKMLELQSGF